MEQQKIQVRDITVAYEQTIVIPKLNLNIPGGKITIVVGGNGCGKSTLIKSVAGILKPKKGEIFINGTEIKKQAPRETAKQMAVLPQSPQVPEGLLVKELVAYGRFPYQKPVGGLTAEGNAVTAPLVGTFYAAPSEGADPFVQVGDTVTKGQIIGIVEAMKLMNEVESEFEGTVVSIPVHNGDIVEYGEPLVIIR